MARASQFSQGRRLVLQATMALVFLCTLALAALMGRQRDRAMAVELREKPHLTPFLAIRLPKEWTSPEQDSDVLPITITSETREGNPRQALAMVVCQVSSPGSPEELLGNYLARRVSGTLGSVRPFSVMGQPGVLARFESSHPVADDPMGRTYEVPSWYAAGVVRGGGPGGADLGVVIGVEGYRTAGPAGSRLVRQLADGLSLRRH